MTWFLEVPLSIIMIHSLNPYGFSHLRRVNEDNIDINRNFLDHTKPHPNNDGYVGLAEFVAPKIIDFWTRIFLWPQLIWYVVSGQTKVLQEAISGGQYSHPDGLFYGGKYETWSNKTIQSICHRYLDGKRRVIFLDFHTGLGKYGKYKIILQHPEDSNLYKRSVEIWGEGNVITTYKGDENSDGDGVALTGPMKLAIPIYLPQTEVTAVTVEFGTSSNIDVFVALREENWLHHHNDPSTQEGREIKERLLRIFYPADNNWRIDVWSAGEKVIHEAIEKGT